MGTTSPTCTAVSLIQLSMLSLIHLLPMLPLVHKILHLTVCGQLAVLTHQLTMLSNMLSGSINLSKAPLIWVHLLHFLRQLLVSPLPHATFTLALLARLMPAEMDTHQAGVT